MELVLLEVPLSNFIWKVEESLEWDEEKTILSNQIILFEYFVNHVLQTDGVIHSFESKALETNFIKVLHHLFSLVMAVFIVQAICKQEELCISILIFDSAHFLRFTQWTDWKSFLFGNRACDTWQFLIFDN